jgi:polysaccharide biosynthesis protein VpsM
MRKREYLNPAFLSALAGTALLSSAAVAQQPQLDSGTGAGAQSIPYSASAMAAAQEGGAQSDGMTLKLMDMLVTVVPSIRIEARHDDNIYYASSNPIADRILVLTPALQLETRRGTNTFSLRMSSAIGRYQKSTADDYANTNVNGVADFDLGTRLRTRLEADYTDGVDPRGSNNNPISATPDHYRQTRGRGVFSYGAQGARGRLDFELGRWQRDYLNNRDTTAASDRVTDDYGATFNWRVGPKTTLLVQGKQSNIDYKDPASTLGSVERALLLGGTWEATAKTQGTFRIGMANKDFDDTTRSGSKQVTWFGAVRWSPRTYSHVNLDLTKAPAETSGGVGNSIDRTMTSARWSHDWNSRFLTEALASYENDAYQGAPRTDTIQNYGIRATYKMRRWLSFGGDYSYWVRHSDDSYYDYRRNVFTLFLYATL